MSFLIVGDDGADIKFCGVSESGATYEVHLERSTSRLYCSCPDAEYRNHTGHLGHPTDGCKHIQAWHLQFQEATQC